MKKTKAVPLILSCLILSACAPQKQYWDSAADMTDQDFYRDKSECSSMAQSSSQQQIHYNPSPSGFADGFINGFNIMAAGQSGTSTEIFNDCMMGRGWFLTSSVPSSSFSSNSSSSSASKSSSPSASNSDQSPVVSAIYRTQYLRDWYDNKDPKFEYAVNIDDRLKDDPHWKGRSLDERFAEATRLTRIHYGEISK